MSNPAAAAAAAPASATVEQPAGAGQQPGQGRGDVDHLSGLYDLTAYPEHLRPHMEEELRKINAGVGRRFQEHAEFRQRFEPFAGIEGLADVHPEDLDELVRLQAAFARASDQNSPNDEDLYKWWDAVGEHFSFFAGPDGAGDPADVGDPGDEPPAWANQLVQRLDGIESRLNEGDQRSAADKANTAVEQKLAALVTEHKLNKQQEARVLQLALAYQGQPDALDKGLADYFAIKGEGGSDLLDGAENGERPGPTLPGGQPAATSTDGLKFGDPALKEAALARLRNASVSGAAA